MSKNGYFDDYEDNGLAPVDDNELGVAAEPEEDFDAFNSETFADGCEGGDEFWEEEHDKLIAMDGDDDAKEEQANEEFNGFKKSSKLDQIDLRQLPDPMISQQHASSLNVNNGHGNNNNSSYTPNQGIENLLLAQFLMQQQQQQRQHSPDIVAKQQQQQQQSILNTIQQQLNMPNQQSDQLNLQKLQLLQQQQQQLQQILQQQQMQQQKAATPSHFPPSASSSQSNMSSSSSQLNEIEIKLMQLFQLQQQLQQEITLQTAQQQKQHAALLASGSMPQSTLVNAQIKQTGHLIQQLQMKNQMNNNQITQLIMMRNNLMNARKTPVAQPSFNEILGNQEKENYLQSKLKELQINAATSSQQNSSSSPSNMDAMFKQSAAAAASAIYQQQLQKAAGMNPAILSMIQQQQQQQSMPAQPPLAPKALPNVKTLEELENELLNASKPKTPPKMDSNDIKTQQQQLEMIKLLSNLNIAGSGSNTGSNSPSLIQQQQNQQQHQQQQQSQDQQASMMLQKQILQAFLLQQNNQGAQHQQQQSQQQSQQQFALSNLSNQLKPNDQLIMQQHQQQLAARINNMLPPNFQHLTPQQKQLILSQRVQLLQQQIQQQQQQGNGLSTNNNNNNGQTAASAIIENLQILEALQLMRVNIELHLGVGGSGGSEPKNEDDMMRLGHQQQHQQQRNNNMGGYNNNNNNNQNRNRRYNYNQNMMMINRKPMHMYSYKGMWNDKLIGMMTDKEKNWVVNVQMLQLQIDDPYKLDFYYTVWMMKKKQFQNSSSTALKTSVLMQSNKQHDSKRTLTFENSLGRVTTSNFHHPRALIDINQKSADSNQKLNSHLPTRIHGLEDDNDDKSKEKKNICNILLEIEKMYEVYLTIDEIEHKILEEPEEIRSALFQDRRAKVDKLASMMCSENFPHYLFVAKGKRLLGKCISSFNVSQTKHILCFFMQYIYAIAKNNLSLDDVYSQVACAIDMHKFNDLVEIVEQFVHLYSKHSGQLFKTIFAHKFCLTYLLKFMSKSELINQDDYDVEVKTLWSSFINLVLTGLATIQPLTIESDGSVKWNIYEQCPLNVRSILDNFAVSSELWSANERKLSELFILSSE